MTASPDQVLRDAARAEGFGVVAVTTPSPLDRDEGRLAAWLAAGFGGDMGYLARGPRTRSTPAGLLPDAASLVTLAVDYFTPVPEFAAEGRFGRVARYAWGRDYHAVVRRRLERVVRGIEARLGRAVRARTLVDVEPLLERAAAARAGLGFVGKSAVVVRPRGGTWSFLAEVLLDLPLEPDGARPSASCGTCRRCLAACPTGAFSAPYHLDARRCVSYLTIENRGPIPRGLREGCGPWVFGCDACQDPCPFNRFASPTAWEELRPEAGVGPRLELAATLSLATDESFRARFAGTPLRRGGRRCLLRNAAVAARNVGATHAVPALAARAGEDPEPLVRGHALWALAVLAPERARPLADRLRRADPDPFVREEAESALQGS